MRGVQTCHFTAWYILLPAGLTDRHVIGLGSQLGVGGGQQTPRGAMQLVKKCRKKSDIAIDKFSK